MAAAAATFCSMSSSSSSSLLLVLRQVLLMPAASSDFKAAACGALFGAGAALLVSHLLLELTFSSVFSTFFSLLFFLLSLLVLQRAYTIRSAVPPPLLPAKEQKLKAQHQHWLSTSSHACHSDAAVLTAKSEGERGGSSTGMVAAENSRGDVEEIHLEEDREDAEAALLLQQEHMQHEYYRFQKEQQHMHFLLLVLAAMLAGSALVAAVVDTRKFQTFHWLLKMCFYILLSNSLCFLLVFAAVDVVNFYYDVTRPEMKSTGSCVETEAAIIPAALFGPPSHFSTSNHYLYTALATSSRPLPFHSSLTDIPYFPIVDTSSPATSSLPLAAAAVDSVASPGTDSPLFPSSTSRLSEKVFAASAVRAAPGLSSADALAASTTGGLPVHNTLQVYVLLGGSLLLGTTFGFFYGMFRFETNPYNSIQLIKSRYVCVPLAAVIGPLAGVLVKRIGDLSTAAAAACMLQHQHETFGTVPYSRSSAPTDAAIYQAPAAAAAHMPYDNTSATVTGSVTPDLTQNAGLQQLFPISTAAVNFIDAEEEEEVEEENLLTFSAAEHRQLLSLA